MTMGADYRPAPIVDPLHDRLDLRKQLDGARLLVMGGTGFLGKVWLSMLLHHFPEFEHNFDFTYKCIFKSNILFITFLF